MLFLLIVIIKNAQYYCTPAHFAIFQLYIFDFISNFGIAESTECLNIQILYQVLKDLKSYWDKMHTVNMKSVQI